MSLKVLLAGSAAIVNAQFYAVQPFARTSFFPQVYEPFRAPLFAQVYDALDAIATDQGHGSSTRSAWTRGTWTEDEHHHTVKINTPPLEEGTLQASVDEDGKTLNLYAKRKITGCTCDASTVGALALPHTPRPEELSLTYDPQSFVLDVKMPRHSKKEQKTPVAVKVLEVDKGRRETTEKSPPEETDSSMLRFVPHASAVTSTEETVEAKEKKVLDKFRAVGRAAVATAQQASSMATARDAADDANKEHENFRAEEKKDGAATKSEEETSGHHH